MKLLACLLAFALSSCAGWYAEIRADTGKLDLTQRDVAASTESIGIAVGHVFGEKAHQTRVVGLLTKQEVFDREMDRRATERAEATALHQENMERFMLASLTTRGVDTDALQDSMEEGAEAELDLSDITEKPETITEATILAIWITAICLFLLTLKQVGILHRFLPSTKKPRDEETE